MLELRRAWLTPLLVACAMGCASEATQAGPSDGSGAGGPTTGVGSTATATSGAGGGDATSSSATSSATSTTTATSTSGAGGSGGSGGGEGGQGGATIGPPPPGELLSPPYLMWVTEDAVSVRWETNTPAAGVVSYGPDAGLGSVLSEAAATTIHEVRLTGLSPASTNHYQVAWDDYILPIASFETARPAGDPSPMTFLVWGDNQNGPSTFSQLIPFMVAENPAFSLSVGDCVQNATRQEFRDQLFGPLAPLADHVPFLVAQGNHELYSDPGALLFDEYMSQPGDEHCFGWSWGNIYITFIDTERPIDPGTPQHQCILDSLSSPEAQGAMFRAAAFHKPPRIEWWFGGLLAFPTEMEAPWVRQTLEPLLESLDVDIVFNGHNHLYAHTPETPGGIQWVTSGGAGGMLDTNFALWKVADWPEIGTTLHEHHFLSVTIDANVMTVRAIDLSGAEIHQFSLTK